MRIAHSCNFSSLLLFFLPQKSHAMGQQEKCLETAWKNNSSGSTIAYIINMWFKVQSVIYRDTKDYDFVCRTQVVGLNQKWSGRPVVSGQNYILNVFRVGDHVVLMEPCNHGVTITHKVITCIFNPYSFVIEVIIFCMDAIFPDVWTRKSHL